MEEHKMNRQNQYYGPETLDNRHHGEHVNGHHMQQQPAVYGGNVGYIQQEQPVAYHDEPQAQSPKYQAEPWFLQIKSHGTKNAIQIETSATKGEWHTINVESAPKDQSDPAGMKFNWKNKTTIQLTKNELPVFIAVMLGMLPCCKFSNHGNTNKFFEIENQGKSFYMKTGGSGLVLHTIPVPAVEGYLFGTLALGQYVRNFHGMTPEAAINIIGRLANQLYSSNSYPQGVKKTT